MSEDLPDWEATWERYVEADVVPVSKRVSTLLNRWQRRPSEWKSVRRDGAPLPNPIQRVKVRIKRPESALDKIRRLGPVAFPEGHTVASLEGMNDFLGARIITFVPAHMRLIDEKLRTATDLRLVPGQRARAYLEAHQLESLGLAAEEFEVKGVKRSGYSSLHYFAQVQMEDGAWSRVFEIQVRSMLEEVWGEIEHQLGYKTGMQTEFGVSRQFRVIGMVLAAMNEHFDVLYDRLEYLQSRNNPAREDALNAENLPRVLADAEIEVSQADLGSLLRILNTYAIVSVGQLKDRLSTSRLHEMRRVIRAEAPGEELSPFHAVSAVAMVPADAGDREVGENLVALLEMVKVTRRSRQKSEG